MPRTQDGAIAAKRPSRRLLLIGLFIFLAILIAKLGLLLHASEIIIHYPYEFDYGEGIVWQQMRNIMRGTGYGPLGVFPAIVYHYPPVYHLVSAAVALGSGIDELAASRLVSVVSACFSAILLGQLAADAIGDGQRSVRLSCSVFAGLVYLSCGPVVYWAPLMRVDMLANLFTLVGLVLACRSFNTSWLIHLSSVAFVLAVYTKQTSIAAPVASYAVLMFVRPKTALAGLASAIVLGSAILVGLCLATNGNFARHIFLYNINRVDLARFAYAFSPILKHSVYVAIAAIGVAAVWPSLRELWNGRNVGHINSVTTVILLVYLALKTAMLVMIAKSGAADNYFIEWYGAVSIFVGIGLYPAIAYAYASCATSRNTVSTLLFGLILAGLPVQALLTFQWDITPAAAARQARAIAPVVDMIRASAKPVISDDMTLPIRAGRDVLWEPAIVAELASQGIYNEAAFIELIRRRHFGFFVTRGSRGDMQFDQRYNPAVAAAIDSEYPFKRKTAGFVLHTPAPKVENVNDLP